MESKELQVGDKLYYTSHYKNVDHIVTIERVTNTQAIAGSTKFKRVLSSQNTASVIGYNSWSVGFWQLENEEMKDRLFRQKAIKEIKETDYKNVPSENLKQILEILTTN